MTTSQYNADEDTLTITFAEYVGMPVYASDHSHVYFKLDNDDHIQQIVICGASIHVPNATLHEPTYCDQCQITILTVSNFRETEDGTRICLACWERNQQEQES